MSTPVTPTPPEGPRPAARGAEGYFNSSRLKVIGLITAATVAVGALGGIAGVVFDPDPIKNESNFEPSDANGAVGSSGQASPRGAAKRLDSSAFSAPGSLPRDDATESPSQVGSISPGSGGITSSPSDDSSQLTEEPSPSDGGTSGDGGQGVTISGTGVDVYVPPGWQVAFQDDTQVLETDGAGSYAFAFSTTVDPSAAAGDVIGQNLDFFLSQDHYTQLQTGDLEQLQPFGSVVSMAWMPYQALWVDNQGSETIAGQMYAGVRQDGTVLVMLIEHLPAEDWENAPAELGDALNATFARFGGVA